MKKEIIKHKTIQIFGNIVKEKVNDAVSNRKTPEELIEDISSMCVKCLLPESDTCDICNGYSANQLFMNLNGPKER